MSFSKDSMPSTTRFADYILHDHKLLITTNESEE
jgi:hypothetical protein